MKLPTGVLAYKVLKIANISNEKQELQTQIGYVKSGSVFYLSKATDGRYQDLKDNSRDDICQYPKDVIEITEISIQGRAIDMSHGVCYYEPKENFNKWRQKTLDQRYNT